jgi:hypothetical protein
MTSTHLIGHDHQMAIPQARRVLVDLLMLQAQDLLQSLDLGIVRQALAAGFSDVEQFAAQGKDAKVVASNVADTSYGERLGRVTFRQDQGALVAVFRAGLVGVFKLGNAAYSVQLAIRTLTA